MTISDEITRIKTNISNAYTSCQNKGATLPETQNSENLATTIDSITGGVSSPTLIDKEITENGTYNASDDNADGYSSVMVNVAGGGSASTGNYTVKVIDYDGTIIKSRNLNEGDTFELPEAPTHSRLVFQSWSSPVTITDNTVTVENQDIIIGATYTTASGLSEFDITLTKATGLDVVFNMDGVKDWGDGTSDEGTNHTYETYGDYTITCDGSTLNTSSSVGLFGQTTSTTNCYCKNVFLGNSITSISNGAFQYCRSLTNATIPNSVTSIGSQTFKQCISLTNIIIIPNSVTNMGSSIFDSCYSLTNATIHNNITNIGSDNFNNCYSLTNITIPNSIISMSFSNFSSCYSLTNIKIPNNIKNIGSNTFYNCNSLTNITIPNSVTKIDSNAFYTCCSLTNITIPNSVTNIGAGAFQYCYNILEYDLTNVTSVPTLSSTSVFNGINKICKIKVSFDLYNDFEVATNWATYADYLYVENPATLLFNVPDTTYKIYIKGSAIIGNSTEYAGSVANYVYHDETNNIVLLGSITDISECDNITTFIDTSGCKKITLSTGVTDLDVKLTIGGITFNATDEGNGDYSIYVGGDNITIDYVINGGDNYSDVSGTITTIGEDITENIELTEASWSTFARPNLSANGTLGGETFAVYASSVHNSSYPAYKAVDSSTSTYWQASYNCYYTLYNPNPIKVTNLTLTYYSSSTTYIPKTVYVYGSNDNQNWEELANVTNSSGVSSNSINVSASNGYNYYKLDFVKYSSYISVKNITITATEKT